MLGLAYIAQVLGGDVRGDGVLVPGPGHSPGDRSLSVKLDDKAPGGFLVHSFSGDDPIECKDYVRSKLGLPPFRPEEKKRKPFSPTVARYTYRTADGQPYLQVQRTAAKDFIQYHRTGENWVSGAPKGPKIPYCLPEMLAASLTTSVYICEGEKDADNLARLGFVATTCSEGSRVGRSPSWTTDLNKYFKDRHVFILPDNDEPGRAHAQHVARNLDRIAASVRIVELPGLPPKGDVSDWLANDPSGARLVKACESAPLWQPTTEKDSDVGDDALILEFAALPMLQYAKRRKETAKKLGIGLAALDKVVAEARGETTSPATGPTPDRWAIEPWDQEVRTCELLQALREVYNRHVILPEHGDVAMVLWCLHAWTNDAAYVSPFLMIKSPEMRCGKSSVLACLYRTGPKTTLASNISSASVFRYIEAHQPTLLIDEADSFARDDDGLRGILNSGHTRDTSFVIRCEGDDNKPREFSTWSPKAIASIGNLAATLQDRSIILPMKRKKPSERVVKLRARDGEPFITLRRKCTRWANDHVEALKDARPLLPDGLNDRAQDNWEPLLAIADLAGDNWPKLARDAALNLSEAAAFDSDTIKVQLLADIEAAFTSLNAERLFSKRLITELVSDETRPWASFKNGKPITERQLARLLADFNIRPANVRIEDAQAKGYERDDFADVFERYVHPDGGDRTVPASQSLSSNDLGEKQSVPPERPGTDQNGANPLKITHWDGGTDQYPSPKESEGECDQCHGPPDGMEQQCVVGGRTVWLHPQCKQFYPGLS